jgi:hypothetical protein
VLFDRYLNAIVTDLGRQVAAGRRAHVPNRRGTALGGLLAAGQLRVLRWGHPTLRGGARLARLLDAVRRELNVIDGAEITIECNPGDRNAGADRRVGGRRGEPHPHGVASSPAVFTTSRPTPTSHDNTAFGRADLLRPGGSRGRG